MPDALRRPPVFALIASLCMLGVGAPVGGVLVAMQDQLYTMALREVVKRPEVHGFVGAEVIDEARIAEVVEQSNNALRMFHVHALGVGMLILLVSLVIVNLPLAAPLQRALCVLVSLGALYPPGWLVLAWLIPYCGLERLRGPVEWGFFVPFGGAIIVGIWGTVAAWALTRGARRKGRPS